MSHISNVVDYYCRGITRIDFNILKASPAFSPSLNLSWLVMWKANGAIDRVGCGNNS